MMMTETLMLVLLVIKALQHCELHSGFSCDTGTNAGAVGSPALAKQYHGLHVS